MAGYAAIYGDAVLMKHLIQDLGVNASFTNCWGESLLVLCCKGGRLDVLKVAIAALIVKYPVVNDSQLLDEAGPPLPRKTWAAVLFANHQYIGSLRLTMIK